MLYYLIMKKRLIYCIIYGLILAGFTAYVFLSRFVIRRSYGEMTVYNSLTAQTETDAAGSDTAGIDASMGSDTSEGASLGEVPTEETTAEETVPEETTVEETTAEPIHTEVTLTSDRYLDTDIHLLYLTLADIKDLRTCFAENSYGLNIKETVLTMSNRVNALAAINGDFYGARDGGYVLRNGTLYRSTPASSTQEDLVIWSDGTADVICEGEVSAEELAAGGAWQVFSFGPGLVIDGEISVSENDEVAIHLVSNPRTAIGFYDPQHYVLLVSDGRTDENAGLTLYELATYMREELGVSLAYNLDGGGSSTMVYEGSIINFPTTNGDYWERSVSDAIYIGYE